MGEAVIPSFENLHWLFAVMVGAATAKSQAIKSWLLSCIQRDTSRLGLWMPIVLGAGAYFYFARLAEPHALIAPIGLACALIGSIVFQRMRPVLVGIFFFAGGFFIADLRTYLVDAPRIENEMRPTLISGVLVSVDEGQRGRRLIIAPTEIDGIGDTALPDRLRITWRGKEFNARPGDKISLRAALSPPPPPVVPGGYDFRRQLFFQKIGGVGFAVTPPRVDEASEKSIHEKALSLIEKARLGLFRRITQSAPNRGGAVVAAMVTGKRGAINDDSEAALRDSGLAHLLAISGLHMGLATGIVFFFSRALLATIEPIALRYPIKKWAAGFALIAGVFYLLLSGAGWSARRAFIMTAIILTAVMLDRKALSLRNVAISATFILLMTPEAILHPGFQMSFAAVTALIAAYEWASQRDQRSFDYSFFGKFKRYTIGIGATDLIAATATAPYSLYHFNRAAIYSLPANLVAMPIMAFWIMPSAVLAIILMPFGIDGFVWQFSAFGVEMILSSASWVSSQKGAVLTMAQWPPIALGVVSLGGIWFCSMTASWRWLALAVLPLCAVFVVLAPRPEIFLDRKGQNVGIVLYENDERVLALLHSRRDKFSAGAWKDHIGLLREVVPTKPLADFAVCDDYGCILNVEGQVVAVSLHPLGFAEDCRNADYIIALFPVSFDHEDNCSAPFIDMRGAWNNGAHTIDVLGDGKFKVRAVRSGRAERPWQ